LQNHTTSYGAIFLIYSGANFTYRQQLAGGGRKSLIEHDPRLIEAFESLVEPTTRGDPMCPLRWTCKSTRKLADALSGKGHEVSHTKVAQLLRSLEYSLQGTRKNLEGA